MAATLAARRVLPLLRLARPSYVRPNYSKLQVRTFSLIASVLNGRKYTSDHDWIVVQDGIGTVGITDYAQDKLGEVVYVDLPEVGAEFAAEDTFGALESVKAASDLNSPVSGTITEINEELSNTPSLVNSSPYDDGWIIKMKVDNPEELDTLMNEEDYDKFVREQDSE